MVMQKKTIQYRARAHFTSVSWKMSQEASAVSTRFTQ